jgi:hypothetical protein
MHYFQNQVTLLGEKLRKRQARKSQLRHLHNLLLLSDTELSELDTSRAEISNHLQRLHLGAASALPR